MPCYAILRHTALYYTKIYANATQYNSEGVCIRVIEIIQISKYVSYQM